MTSLLSTMVSKYDEVFEEKSDRLVDQWPLVKSPVPVIAIILLYLYFVLKLGPRLMKNRPAYELTNMLIWYNLFQVFFNLWMCSLTNRVDNLFLMLFKHCGSFGESPGNMLALSDASWWYFFSKVIELLDTVFFVLRKKQSQVTFLHVYHHSAMVMFTWTCVKWSYGEQTIIPGFLNTCVHVVMYSYYLIAALGPKYQKYLWWKRYMTWIQMTQFVLMLAYFLYIASTNCGLARGITVFLTLYVVVFLYLFSDFYRKAYRKKSEANGIMKSKLNID